MDEKILKIVARKLKQYEGQPITQEKLTEIRQAVYSATKTNKFASFANVKKWVKAARSMLKSQQKKEASPPQKAKEPEKSGSSEFADFEVPRKVEETVNMIKDELASPPKEVALPKPQIVFDKVYLQSIKFEIASIRQTMERVSRQLDKLEKELSSHASEE
ncbi:MAG: hypothetical protein N3G80_00570 [Candidatus Micrarchaeota archaeon]|nr:hypothetical protein [Candidatus Micrarchaeota archaeon]